MIKLHKPSNGKRWKPGEMKTFLAEQKALHNGWKAQKQMYEDGKAYSLWVEMIKRIQLDSSTRYAAEVNNLLRSVNGFVISEEDIDVQYNNQCRASELFTVVEGKNV